LKGVHQLDKVTSHLCSSHKDLRIDSALEMPGARTNTAITKDSGIYLPGYTVIPRGVRAGLCRLAIIHILQKPWLPQAPILYYVFDVLIVGGRDGMRLPLISRRDILERRILPELGEPIRYSPELQASLADLISFGARKNWRAWLRSAATARYERRPTLRCVRRSSCSAPPNLRSLAPKRWPVKGPFPGGPHRLQSASSPSGGRRELRLQTAA